MIYKIRINEILSKLIYIDAQSEEEAIDRVTELYNNEEIVLAGCGGDEYIFRKNEGKLERFV
mgnify:CR=1 FL=1